MGGSTRRIVAILRRHPTGAVAGLGALVFVGAVLWTTIVGGRVAAVPVRWDVPVAPELTATAPTETVYRIDPTQSSVRYSVDEVLAGVSHTAEGTTHGVAGDLLLDAARPDASRIGEIVVNVEQLTSDQSIRDERIRHDFLESTHYPEARFRARTITGLPPAITDDTDHHLRVSGDLTVKDVTRQVVLDTTARRTGGTLHIRATTTVTLADFGIGPISIVGLVRTGDQAVLTLDLVAVDVASVTFERAGIGAEQAEPATLRAGPGAPSYARTVEPVLERSCAGCHNTGRAGATVWTLDTAADASRSAAGLALVTGTGYMPPWGASGKGVALDHDLRLDRQELADIRAWAKLGGPLDVDPAAPVSPIPTDQPQPRHDQELRLTEAYQGSSARENDYRCFQLDPGLVAPATVTGYDVLADQPGLVHHAGIYRLHADRAGDIAAADDAAPGPGWPCFGDINVRRGGAGPAGGFTESDLLMGWAPGQPPTAFPEGTGLRVEPGDRFVIQIHYHMTGSPPPDRSGIALEYGREDPASYRAVTVRTYQAPAEIPCAPGENAPRCDRSVELAHLADLYGPLAPAIAEGLHTSCGTTPTAVGRLVDGVASSSCDHAVTDHAELLSVYAHMHEIGKAFRMTLNPGRPDQKILLDIPRWDFEWQYNYFFADPVLVRPGDVIRVQCSWDRALVPPDAEPHHITWAEGTNDEMCFSDLASAEPPR